MLSVQEETKMLNEFQHQLNLIWYMAECANTRLGHYLPTPPQRPDNTSAYVIKKHLITIIAKLRAKEETRIRTNALLEQCTNVTKLLDEHVTEYETEFMTDGFVLPANNEGSPIACDNLITMIYNCDLSRNKQIVEALTEAVKINKNILLFARSLSEESWATITTNNARGNTNIIFVELPKMYSFAGYSTLCGKIAEKCGGSVEIDEYCTDFGKAKSIFIGKETLKVTV